MLALPKWNCPKCNHSNNSHATYCLKCGFFKKDIKNYKMYWICPSCHEENSNHVFYCIKCGHRYQDSQSTTLNMNNNGASKWKKFIENVKVIVILELIIMGIACFISIVGEEGSVNGVITTIFLIHLFFGMYYIMLTFSKSGFGEAMKSILIQGGLLIGMLMMIALTNESSDHTVIDSYSLNFLKNNAIEVDYDKLYHIAFERYGSQRNQLVKFSGKVFLLDGSDYILIDMSPEPYKNQVVYVKRKEQDHMVSINDQVEIYGKVLGTASVAKHLDKQLNVPVIESYSLTLR